MNLILIIAIIAIIGILMWTFLGDTRSNTSSIPGKIPHGTSNSENENDEITDEILEQKKKEKSRTRRADDDHEIGRRKSDFIKPGEDFRLPYRGTDIIPEDSPFGIYQKTVENAQNYLNKGDYETARTLYEGLKSRISDRNITGKLEDNLEYIENFRQIASKKIEQMQRKEVEFPSNEIKLSMSGHDSLPDHIQIGITPQKDRSGFDIDEIANRISQKIDERQMLTPESFRTNKQLEDYRRSIERLKTEVDELNELKKVLEKERNERISQDRRELESLKSRLADLQSESVDGDSLNEMKNELEKMRTEKTSDEEKNSLQNEINRLSRENLELQKDVISRTEVSNRQNDELRVQISNLQSELSGLLSQQQQSEGLTDRLNDMISSEGKNRDIDEMKDQISSIRKELEGIAPAGSEHRSSSETTEVKNTMRKELEDRDEDFETLEHYLNGPKFNEPTDEDILGKILNDAAKEHHEKLSSGKTDNSADETAEEYEIKGSKKNDQELENFDINMLFDKPDPKKDFENQFYSKFMERQKPSGKKELPILKVTYNFDKLPDSSTLSREQNVLESSFYKYKPMIEKANQLLKRRKVKDALNYYEVVLNQDIPVQFKEMIKRNIQDLNDYLEKYMMN